MTFTLSQLLAAMIAVESGGDPGKVGDYVNGKATAIGILQIHKIAVDDVNTRYGSHWTWPDDCYDVGASKLIWFDYCRWRGGAKFNAEKWSRAFNGGPHGWLKPSTLAYWLKVKAELEKQKGS